MTSTTCYCKTVSLFLFSVILSIQLHSQSLFETSNLSADQRSDISNIVGLEEFTLLDLNVDQLRQLRRQSSQNLQLNIPVSANETIGLALSENLILGDDFQSTRASTGASIPYNPGNHYFGNVDGYQKSIAGISIFDDHIVGVISYEGNNYNLEPLALRNNTFDTSQYIIYKDADIPQKFSLACGGTRELDFSDNIGNPSGNTNSNNRLAAVGIYIECDHRMYNDNGASVAATTSWTTAMMNVVIGIFSTAFTNSGATTSSLFISQIVVWDTPDPYGTTVNGTDSFTILDNFVCNIPSYNGRIAHLLSTTNAHGGVAYSPFNAPCIDESTNYGYSSIANSYNANLNIYSWTINVVAHEIGHQLSSPHTHDCVWNGNGTQIDDCGNEWLVSVGENPGSCYDAANQILPAAGTIMSYCHANPSGTGVDLAQSFHPQVENQIGNYVENCISTSIGGCLSVSQSDITLVSSTFNSATVSCAVTAGIDLYIWGYRVSGGQSFMTSGQVPNSTYTFTGLLPNTNYDVRVRVHCTATNTWSTFSCISSFNTSTCPTSYSIAGGTQLTGIQNTSADYETDGDIESIQTLTNSITVDYDSKTAITLMNDFLCNPSVNFTAFIDGCGNLLQQDDEIKN